jgi:hypothetical protein
MNKRLFWVIGGVIFFLILTFIIIRLYDNHLYKQKDLQLPSRISSYSDIGYFKIDPETILASLEREDSIIFTPLLKDPQDITDEVTNISIRWRQSDFLKIASTLGLLVWGDPLDLQDWSVYSITFEGFCDDPAGFDYAKIAYFKTGGVNYTTRLIEIHPYFGWVRWGDGKTYPKPILQKWNRVDLFGENITADDALRIASEDAKERFESRENCGVIVGLPQNNDFENWHLHYFGSPGFTYIVNLETGNFTFQKLNN